MRKNRKVRIVENYCERGEGVNCMVQLHIEIASDFNPQAKEGVISNVTTIKGHNGTQWLIFSSFLFSSSIQIYWLKSGI